MAVFLSALGCAGVGGRDACRPCEYHVAVEDSCWTRITFWTHVRGCMYRVSHESALVKTSCLPDTCPIGSDASMALPS